MSKQKKIITVQYLKFLKKDMASDKYKSRVGVIEMSVSSKLSYADPVKSCCGRVRRGL